MDNLISRVLTPLHTDVLYFKKLTVMKEILKLGVDVNSKDIHLRTPLFNVIRYHHNGNFSKYVDHRDALENGAVEPDVKKLQMLLQGLDDAEKDSIFHFSIQCCYSDNVLEELRLLIKYGADVNDPHFYSNFTPLHMAVIVKSNLDMKLDVIKLLWEKGADFTLEASPRETPLFTFLKKIDRISLPDLDIAKLIIQCTLIQESKSVNLGYYIKTHLKTCLQDTDSYLFKEGILKNGEGGLLSYYKGCRAEIRRMKRDIIIHKKSIFELVSETDFVTVRNLKIQEIKSVINLIFQRIFNNIYPIFTVSFISRILNKISLTGGYLKREDSESMIMQIFQRFADFDYPLIGVNFISNLLSRTDLNDILIKLQMYSGTVENGEEKITLNYYCIMNVAKFLPDKDLINLILASCEKRKCKIRASSYPIFPIKMDKNLTKKFADRCRKHTSLESSRSML